MLFASMCNSPTWNRYKPLHESVIGDAVIFISRKISTVESRSIVSTSIVFPHVLFAIFGPELSSI